MSLKRLSGQTLLEVLVALSAALIVMSAITAIVLGSLSQSVQSNKKNQATAYAQEGIEVIQLKQNVISGQRYCLGDDNVLQPGTCAGESSQGFKRDVVISDADCGGLKKVTVSVSWHSSACTEEAFCHVIPISSCI